MGEPVKAGDVICTQKSGLISRLFRASQDGMVVAIRDGRITLALGEKEAASAGNFPGTVVEIIPRPRRGGGCARLAAAGRVGQRAEQLRRADAWNPRVRRR